MCIGGWAYAGMIGHFVDWINIKFLLLSSSIRRSTSNGHNLVYPEQAFTPVPGRKKKKEKR